MSLTLGTLLLAVGTLAAQTIDTRGSDPFGRWQFGGHANGQSFTAPCGVHTLSASLRIDGYAGYRGILQQWNCTPSAGSPPSETSSGRRPTRVTYGCLPRTTSRSGSLGGSGPPQGSPFPKNLYAGGDAVYQDGLGNVPDHSAGYDAGFVAEFRPGAVTSTAEPATIGLVAMGLVGIGRCVAEALPVDRSVNTTSRSD